MADPNSVVKYITRNREEGHLNPVTRGAGVIRPKEPEKPNPNYITQYKPEPQPPKEKPKEKAPDLGTTSMPSAPQVGSPVQKNYDHEEYRREWRDMTEAKMAKLLVDNPFKVDQLMTWVQETPEGSEYRSRAPMNLFYTYDEDDISPAQHLANGTKPKGKYLPKGEEYELRQKRLKGPELTKEEQEIKALNDKIKAREEEQRQYRIKNGGY